MSAITLKCQNADALELGGTESGNVCDVDIKGQR